MPRWIYLGALRSRLFGGNGLRKIRGRDLVVPIGAAPGDDVIVDTGSRVELDVFQEILVDGIYPLDRLQFVPAMILDCGANVGYFASACRVRFPKAKIVCFEPDPDNFARLVGQPVLKTDVVHCEQSAVSATDGTALLSGEGVGCTLEPPSAVEGRRIRTLNFATWITRHAQWPLLVKMDIEGHEAVVIETLRNAWGYPCALFLETHATGGQDEKILIDLQQAGFNMQLSRTRALTGDARIFKEYVGHRAAAH